MNITNPTPSTKRPFSHLIISGAWHNSETLWIALQQRGITLTFAPSQPISLSGVVLLALQDKTNVHLAATMNLAKGQWLAWNRAGDSAVSQAAYTAGAIAVLPSDTTADLLLSVLNNLTPHLPTPPVVPSSSSTYTRGQFIPLPEGHVLHIQKGIIEMTTLHPDGNSVLLGFCGIGHTLIGHGDDHCHIQLIAHTSVQATSQSWEQATRSPNFSQKLKERIAFMEAWAAMQARQHLEQRILGILGLLAEQFGTPHPQGILVDLRLTHEQLASAIGSSRITVTRILGNLRTRQLLATIKTADGDRFCLTSWQPNHHTHRPL